MIDRRAFLRLSGIGAAAAMFGKVFHLTPAFAAEEVVSLDDPTAKALGYQHDASKVDTAKFPNRASAEGKSHFCSNCSFAQGQAKEVAGQEGKWVGCQLFPGKLVNEQGWCNTWMPKAS